MDIRTVKLFPDGDGYSLFVYINQSNTEFSAEFGEKDHHLKPSFRQEIAQIVRDKFPNVKVTTVTIIMGTMLIGSIPFSQIEAKAIASSDASTQTSVATIPYITYSVKSGDSLSKIAAANGITISQITQINQINGTTIYVGQTIKLPFVTHTVSSGDTLSFIAKKYYSSVESIKAKNNLTTDIILIGQRLIVPVFHLSSNTGTVTNPITDPVPEPIVSTQPTQVDTSTPVTTEYRVVSGDTLSLIAKRFNTTVMAIKTENQLTSDLIRVGQILKIPSAKTDISTKPITEAPTPTTTPIVETTPVTTEYRVVSGDTLSLIAKRFNTTVMAIKTENQLTSDLIRVGQILKIPGTETDTSTTPITDAPTPTTSPIAETAPDSGNNTTQDTRTYIVVSGDTLSIIANKYNTTSKDIMAANNLNSDVIYVGQKLIIPTKIVEPVIVKDTTPPEIPSVQTDTITNASNVGAFQVSGKTESGANVSLIFLDEAGHSLTKQIKADDEGNFKTINDLSSLQDGKITISTYSEDSTGNQSIKNIISIEKDTTGPNHLLFNRFTKISNQTIGNYTITGNTEANSSIDMIVTDGVNTNTTTIQADGNGLFSFAPELTGFHDGEVTIKAITRDQHGNLGNQFVEKVVKDTTINPVSAVELENSGKINKANVQNFSISGSSDEEDSIVSVSISDGVNTITEEALVLNSRFDKEINLASLDDGILQVSIIQRDQVGNISEKITTTMEKDTTVVDPVIYTSKVEKAPTGLLYRISGTGEPGSTIELTVMGQTGTEELRQIIQTNNDGTFEHVMNISSISKPFVMINQSDLFGNKTSNSIVGITSYVVGSGDTLWGISTRFNTSIASIKAINNLTSDMLTIGQELKLPVVAGVQSPNISEQEFFNMGYLYFGNTQSYIEGINQTANTINVVSPSYFDLNGDGTLKLTANFDRQFIVSSQSAGVRVVPFLSNHWDRSTGELALKNREQLSSQIAEAVQLYNLDGVNVDIENVSAEYREEYTDFVRLLRDKIPENKEVSVAVAANPNGLTTGWHGSYDYTGLAKYSDYLMIMAYDESYPGSDAGPIASIGFVDQSIQYALNQGVAKDQIVVGVGHYGRYWKEGESYGGDGISNNQIQKALELYNGTVGFDEATKSAIATFTIEKGDPVMTVSGKTLTEGTYTVWFENTDAIKAKIDLIHQYDVKGLGNWSIGQDNPLLWKDISAWLQAESSTVSEGTNP